MFVPWPGNCDEDCEVGSCLPMDPGNDGDGEGTLRPSFRDDAWPENIISKLKHTYLIAILIKCMSNHDEMFQRLQE